MLAIVMPAFRSKGQILDVLAQVPSIVEKVFVIDDNCPDQTGEYVKSHSKDPRIEVFRNEENMGVGGAVIQGFRLAEAAGARVIVKLDSDGQMNPADIPRLIRPIQDGKADYAKGNRFNSLEDLQQMPKVRVFGNASLSLLSKFSTGYWSITDPTNGFVAISAGALRQVNLDKLRKRWFFESDLLFRLSIARAVVADVPIRARYANERSNLKISSVFLEFAWRHLVNYLKRIFYLYYLRDWSVASFQLPASIALMISGLALGVNYWVEAASRGVAATTGQVMLAVLPILVGFQLHLSFLGFDVANEPKNPLYADQGSDS